MGADPVKVKKNAIITSAVDAFQSHRKDSSYDFTDAAKAMTEEAFNLGKLVGSGKAVETAEEEA